MTKPCPECGNPETRLEPEKRTGVELGPSATEQALSAPALPGADLVVLAFGLAMDGLAAVGKAVGALADTPEKMPPNMVVYCPKCGWWEPAPPQA